MRIQSVSLHFAAMSLTLCMAQANAAESQTVLGQRASQFASEGMAFTLKGCELPLTCGGERPVRSTEHKRQTSNDVDVDQRVLYFNGLEVNFWYVLGYAGQDKPKNPYDKPEILGLKLTHGRWPVLYGLNVGVSRILIIQTLGQGQPQGNCIYYFNEDKQDEVRFCFEENKVKSIEWVPWNDA